MEIHLVSDGIDDVLTLGPEPDDEATLTEARRQVPPEAFDNLVPPILETANVAIRMVMMYHAALAYLDQNDRWDANAITFTVDRNAGRHTVEVD